MRSFRGVAVSYLLVCVILGCFVGSLIGSEPPIGKSTIQGRVSKVFPSPGFWAGIAESLQWFDMKVVKSGASEIKPGVVLHIGVPVVKGNPLFDAQTPQFASDKLAPGILLELAISTKCSQARGPGQYVVEPNCIHVPGAPR